MPSNKAHGFVAQVRAVVLTTYPAVAQAVGLDPYAMLREAGIDPLFLADPEARLPASAVSFLLDESARRSRCESFGLQMAERRSFASLGPLSLLLRHERDFRTVLRRLRQYRRLMGDVVDYDLVEEGEEARILVLVAPEVATRQCVELAMGLTCRFLGGAMFGGWHPEEACFRYPPPADPQIHQRLFRTRLRFDAPFNGFVVPVDSLDRANASADSGFAGHALHFVELLAAELPALTLAEQVRGSIASLLGTGAATLSKVARQLGIHPRALQRALATDGLTFGGLVESVRETLSRELLANTDLPLGEVGLLVGYASPASFSRWFKASAGLPPHKWRARSRAAEPNAQAA
jgi:AraC-like DNA-binding protein